MNGCPTRSRRVSVPPMHRPLALSMRSSSATRHRRCLGTEKRFQSEVVQFSALFLPAPPPFPSHPVLNPGSRFSPYPGGSQVLSRGLHIRSIHRRVAHFSRLLPYPPACTSPPPLPPI